MVLEFFMKLSHCFGFFQKFKAYFKIVTRYKQVCFKVGMLILYTVQPALATTCIHVDRKHSLGFLKNYFSMKGELDELVLKDHLTTTKLLHINQRLHTYL